MTTIRPHERIDWLPVERCRDMVGGMYRITALNGSAPSVLVLVTRFVEYAGVFAVTLLSPDMELGSSAELVVPADVSGAPYDLLVHSDVFGYATVAQVCQSRGEVGFVGPDVLASLSALRNGDPVEHSVAGPPVVERSDPRWGFKISELNRLRACTSGKKARR